MADEDISPQAAPKRSSNALRLGIGVLLIGMVVFGAWYLTSPRFASYVTGRVVATIDQATGGHASIGQLRWNLSKLEVEVRDFTIRGREAAGEKPLAHAGRLFVRLKVYSIFGGDFGIRFLSLEQPVIHLITYPDGTTNLPTPRRKGASKRTPIEEVFHLAIDRAEIHDGLLLYNNQALPLDFSANNMQAAMTYAPADNCYHGQINLGKLDAKFQDMRPVSAVSEIDFSLFPTRVELRAFRLTSGKSKLEASGELVNFNDPRIALAYRATLDLAEAGAITRNPRLRGGVADLNGKGSMSRAGFNSDGRLQLRNGVVEMDGSRLAGLDGGANFIINPEKVQLTSLFLKLLGGALTGNASVLNWSAKPGVEKPQQGSALLEIRNLQVEAAAATLAGESRPLNKVKPAGSLSGVVSAHWTGSPANVVAQLSLESVPPAQPAGDQVPLTARLEATYNAPHQTLDVQQLNAATRATNVEGAGSIGRANANLRFRLNTTNLVEFEPALAAFGMRRLPVELGGSATFNGAVSGKLKTPTLFGHLEVSNFNSIFWLPENPQAQLQPVAQPQSGASPATPAKTREVKLHWDHLGADLLYAPARASAEQIVLRHGKTQITGAAQIGLQQGRTTDASPIGGSIRLSDGDLAELQQIAGYNYPLRGTVNAAMNASGTLANPRANATLAITRAKAGSEPIDSLTLEVSLADRNLDVSSFAVANPAGRIAGTAGYNLNARTFRFNLRGTGIDLAKLQLLQTVRTQVTGRATLVAQGSGAPGAPSLNGSLQMQNVVVNGENVGNISLAAVTQGSDLRLTGSANFETATLNVDGSVRLRGDFPGRVTLHFANLDVDSALRAYLQGRVTGHSSINGDIRAEGPLRRPADLNVVGEIRQFSMELERVRLRNDGPVRFTLAQEQVRLEQLRIVGDETEFSAAGAMRLDAGKSLDVKANGHVNMRLIESVNPAFNSSGQLTMEIAATGSMARPVLNGQIQIQNASISYIDLPNGLSNVNGRLVFDQGRLEVQRLTGYTGGGALNITGFITYTNGIGFNLRARAKEIRLRYPPGVSSGADADLRLTGTPQNSLLAGDVTVTKFALDTHFDFSLYLARAKQPPSLPSPDSPLNTLRLDIHVVSTPELQVQTSMAKLSGDVDLHLRGAASRPVVLGRVNIVEGNIFFNGTTYQLERGDVTFTNPVRIEPVLNVEASARVRDYDITIGLHGPIDRLSTTYRSDPPLASADIIALLAFGRTREESVYAQNTATFTETASNAILGQALNSVVSNRVEKLFGVSRIKIDPQVGTATSNPTARLTIEQTVSNKITMTYITDVTQSSQQVVQLEYSVNRNFSVIAVRDQYGVVSFNIRYRQRKR
ncbi:MAG TPA: translocation/assembly module TamB domain-containing protein [Terriglobales bacterium]|nr:translocation/assembly module TamB domain-containing protein [Terriglobales bacterium]